jgi:hypothetical protein
MTEAEKTTSTEPYQLSHLAIPLLKGVLYRVDDPGLWNALLNLQASVRDYFAVLGLALHLDEAEGYAFLRSRVEQEDEEQKLPRLIVRRPLSFPVSLLLALLRRKLAEFDAGGGDTRLVLSRDEIVALVRVFLPESTNDSKLVDQIEKHIDKVVDLGFVRRLKSSASSQGGQSEYEVMRILKAFVDAQWLTEFDQRLAAYQAQMQATTEGSGDE